MTRAATEAPHGTATGEPVIIIGAGQAGFTTAASLRDAGWAGLIHLVGAEDEPHQRPPLSKGYLAGVETEGDLTLSTAEKLCNDGIDYRPNQNGTEVDRIAQRVTLASGDSLPYGQLIFATGSRARTLPLAGGDLDGVHTLRTRRDADLLKGKLAAPSRFVIVGGGFIGLEVAATAAKAGHTVTVVEVAPRLLERALSPSMADHLAEVHRAQGVEIRYQAGVAEFVGNDGRVGGVVLLDGSTLPADLVLVAVGAAPRTELAEAAGLAIQDGILTDEHLQTFDPAIHAVGDCARYPNLHAQATVRLESVQNATDTARHAAQHIMGTTTDRYHSVPWFWSHQFQHKLQIAGVAAPADSETPIPASKKGAIAVARERDGQLVALETINDPRTHLKARRLLAEGPVERERLEELFTPKSPSTQS